MLYLALTSTAAICAFLGVLINARRDHRCFYLWIYSNAVWASIDWIQGEYPRALLMTFYFFFAFYALRTWKKKALEAEA